MAEEHGVAGGPAHHAQHRQPHVRQGLRGEPGALQIKNHADEGRSAIIKAGECSVLTLPAPIVVLEHERMYTFANCQGHFCPYIAMHCHIF